MSRESWEGFAGDAHAFPLGLHNGAHLMVEVDGWLVPVEDTPFEAGTAFGYGDCGDTGEERFADALAAISRANEEVFDVDACVPGPCGVAVEVESEAYGGA